MWSEENMHLDQSVAAYGHHAILILNRGQVKSGGHPHKLSHSQIQIQLQTQIQKMQISS